MAQINKPIKQDKLINQYTNSQSLTNHSYLYQVFSHLDIYIFKIFLKHIFKHKETQFSYIFFFYIFKLDFLWHVQNPVLFINWMTVLIFQKAINLNEVNNRKIQAKGKQTLPNSTTIYQLLEDVQNIRL